MPFVVLTSVLMLSEMLICLPSKLFALDFQIPDTVHDELEDLAHRGVVDGSLVLLGDPAQDLLFALGIEEGLARLSFYGQELLHDARPLVEDAYELSVDLVYPAPELSYPGFRVRVLHREPDCIHARTIRQTTKLPPQPGRRAASLKAFTKRARLLKST